MQSNVWAFKTWNLTPCHRGISLYFGKYRVTLNFGMIPEMERDEIMKKKKGGVKPKC
jgi:hypothetical protein